MGYLRLNHGTYFTFAGGRPATGREKEFGRMSWECKHLLNGSCLRLKTSCSPGIKGCVLAGKCDFPFKEEKKRPGPTKSSQAAEGKACPQNKPGY